MGSGIDRAAPAGVSSEPQVAVAAGDSARPSTLAEAGAAVVSRIVNAVGALAGRPEARGKSAAQIPAEVQKALRNVRSYDEASVARLVAAGAVDDFLRYLRVCAPDLGMDALGVDTFLVYRKEVGDVCRYHGRIPHVRNYHRLEKAALDALVTNWRDRSRRRPLRLVVASGHDGNGFLHRNVGVTSALTHSSHLGLLIEGRETLGDIQALIGPVAQSHGQDGRISELILAAHASSTLMLVANDERSSPADTGTSEPPSPAQQAKLAARSGRRDLSIDRGAKETQDAEAFFDEVLSHMSVDPAAEAQIALMGCHVASSSSVSSKGDGGRPLGREQVRDLMLKQTSLADFLRERAARKGQGVQVIAPTTYAYSSDRWIDPQSGELAPRQASDPAAYSDDRTGYVEKGLVPAEVMSAVQVAWGKDRPRLLIAMARRLASPPGGAWDPLIAAFFELLIPQIENPRVLHDLREFSLHIDIMTKGSIIWPLFRRTPPLWRPQLYGALARTPAWQHPSIRLLSLQSWAVVDAGRDAELMSAVTALSPAELAQWTYNRLLGPVFPRLLRSPSASPPIAELKLALAAITAGLNGGPDLPLVARQYLRAVLGSAQHFPIDITPHLDPSSSESAIIGAIGRGPGVVKAAAGALSPFDQALVQRGGKLRVDATPRQGPDEAYAPASVGMISAHTEVVVYSELRLYERIPAQRWFRVLGPHGEGWLPASAIDLRSGPLATAAPGLDVRPGAPDAPVRVLLSALSSDAKSTSARILKRLAQHALPQVVLSTSTVAGSWSAVDAFVDSSVRGAAHDAVIALTDGAASQLDGAAVNSRVGLDEEAKGSHEVMAPIRPGAPAALGSTLPMARILADQRARLGKSGLGDGRQAVDGNLGVANYLLYRELDATKGSGAMVGMAYVSSYERDLAAVERMIESVVAEVRQRRRARATPVG